MKDRYYYDFNFSKCYALKSFDGFLSEDCSSLVDLSSKNVKLFDRYVDVKRFLKRLNKRGISGFYVAFLVSVSTSNSSRRYLMLSRDYCLEDMVDFWEDFLMKKGGKNA